MFEWVGDELDRYTVDQVREQLHLGQVEFGRLVGCSRAAIQRAEMAEHTPDPIAVANGEPMPSWSLRVGCRRSLLLWVLLAIDDDDARTARKDSARKDNLLEAFRRLRILRITAEGLDPELSPESWALALRLAVQADTWVPLRQPTLQK